MSWVQIYDPLGSPLASTVMAAAPVCLLLGLLVAGVPAQRAALAVAVLGFGMPLQPALASAIYGAAFGLLPIGWIVVAAVFMFPLNLARPWGKPPRAASCRRCH